MLVKLKRNWFDNQGHLHRAHEGLAELPDDYNEKDLPRDAVVISKTGSLPSPAPKPQPGFGAKPEHEQVLDQVPYAAPTHLLTPGGEQPDPAGIHPPLTPPTDEEIEQREKDDAKAAKQDEKDRKDRLAEESAQVKEGLKTAKKMEDAQSEGDPTRKSQIKI